MRSSIAILDDQRKKLASSSIPEFMKAWDESLQEQGYSKSTRYNYSHGGGVFASWAGVSSASDLAKITPQDVISFCNRPVDLSMGTKSLHKACVREMFAFAESTGIVPTNPVRSVRRINIKSIPEDKRETARRRPWSDDQFNAWIEFLHRQRLSYEAKATPRSSDERMMRYISDIEFMTVLCYEEGLRISDASSIKWDAFMTRPGFIRLHMHKTGKPVVVPIAPRVWAYLSKRSMDDPVYLFPAEVGNGMRKTSWCHVALMQKLITKFRSEDESRAGLVIHGMRHSFVSRLVNLARNEHRPPADGRPWQMSEEDALSVAQKCVGHASPNTTMIYCHEEDE